jgi:hypothetical protein
LTEAFHQNLRHAEVDLVREGAGLDRVEVERALHPREQPENRFERGDVCPLVDDRVDRLALAQVNAAHAIFPADDQRAGLLR